MVPSKNGAFCKGAFFKGAFYNGAFHKGAYKQQLRSFSFDRSGTQQKCLAKAVFTM